MSLFYHAASFSAHSFLCGVALESMVFVQYLVEKHGLDAMIEAEMDNKTYRELFPDAAAFQEEYDNFVAQINFD